MAPRDIGSEEFEVASASEGRRMVPVPHDETLRVLQQAREWLSDPAHWCKHRTLHETGATCSVGAIEKFNNGLWGAPYNAIDAAVPEMEHRCVINFNDARATTHADVLGLFDRAIAARRAEIGQ